MKQVLTEKDARLLDALASYQGDNPTILAGALAVRIVEHPELAKEAGEFAPLYSSLPEFVRPAMRAMVLLSAGHGTPEDRETLRLWIENLEKRGSIVPPELHELLSGEAHT